ncbi:hypothetical protein [Paenibacillus sp. PL2-23]|uniref:hypothetical protein n=1 Tax=Paenibacillus sp. PL2-23 TaxID=2100729 RepID=UPI0030F5C201
MDSLILLPYVGIGPVKLGMRKWEVQAVFQTHAHLKRPNQAYNESILEELFVRLEYDKDQQVNFLEVINPAYAGIDHIPILYDGIDVFGTKAVDLVARLDGVTPYNRNPDSESGHLYVFPETQLSLWREGVMTEEMMNAKVFQEMLPENQELEKRYLYFTTVSIAAPDYSLDCSSGG